MKKDSSALMRKLLSAIAVVGALSAAAVGTSALAGPAEAESLRHLRLVSTSPAADAVVEGAPAEVRLVFSEPPRSPGSTVRLTRGTDVLVATTSAAPDSADAKQIVIRPTEPLSSGSYVVHWRVIAQDGHAQNGTFGFRIAGD